MQLGFVGMASTDQINMATGQQYEAQRGEEEGTKQGGGGAIHRERSVLESSIALVRLCSFFRNSRWLVVRVVILNA